MSDKIKIKINWKDKIKLEFGDSEYISSWQVVGKELIAKHAYNENVKFVFSYAYGLYHLEIIYHGKIETYTNGQGPDILRRVFNDYAILYAGPTLEFKDGIGTACIRERNNEN